MVRMLRLQLCPQNSPSLGTPPLQGRVDKEGISPRREARPLHLPNLRLFEARLWQQSPKARGRLVY